MVVPRLINDDGSLGLISPAVDHRSLATRRAMAGTDHPASHHTPQPIPLVYPPGLSRVLWLITGRSIHSRLSVEGGHPKTKLEARRQSPALKRLSCPGTSLKRIPKPGSKPACHPARLLPAVCPQRLDCIGVAASQWHRYTL